MKRHLVSLILIITTLYTLAAEIAPQEYHKMKMGAEEQVEISVLRSKTRRPLFSKNTQVTLEAQIVSVTTSASGLKAGDRITISYIYRKLGKNVAGPRPIPIQRKGTITPAFLDFDPESNTYVPAARGASFEYPIM